jgi:hypothetical protein
MRWDVGREEDTYFQSIRGEAFVELVGEEELYVTKIDLLGIEGIVIYNDIIEAQSPQKGDKLSNSGEVRDAGALFVLAFVDGIDELLEVLFEAALVLFLVFHNKREKVSARELPMA